MHVDRLDRYQRAQLLGRLDDDLRDEPGIDELVVRVDEDPAIPGAITPRRDFGHPPPIHVRGQILGLWAGGKEFEHARSPQSASRSHLVDVAPTHFAVQP